MTFLKKLEFKIKAGVFVLFKWLLKKSKGYDFPLDGSKYKKVLLIRPDRIGDTVCSLPLFDLLKKKFPNMEFSIYASPKNVGLIKDDPRFKKIYLYYRNIFKDIREVMKIRRAGYDILIDMIGDDSVTSLFLSQFSVSRVPRLGINKRKFGSYYDYSYNQPSPCTDHIIDINLELARAFGVDPVEADHFAHPHITEKSEQRAEEFMAGLDSDGITGPKVAINLSTGAANRFWGLEKFGQLIERIHREFPQVRLFLISAPSERWKGESLETKYPDMVSQIFPGAGLTEVSSILKRLDLLITGDTSLVHIARSFQTDVIGFYPEFKQIYLQWLPYRQKEGLVLSYGGGNVFNITVDEAFRKFREMIGKKIDSVDQTKG